MSLPVFFKKPLVWIILVNAALFITGIWWGLPSSEDWHSDSLAPYHPLLGLSQLFSFGYLNKYPLVHQFILSVLNIPVAAAAFINSNPMDGLSLTKFIMLLRSPEYATLLTLTDRLVSALMGLGIIYYMYKCVKELFGGRTAVFAAFLLTFDAVFNFYAHMAKVEVPYIFWAFLGMYMLIRVVKYERTRDYIYLALFSCLCYGTKDQGYAVFVLPFILYLIVYKAVYREAGQTIIKAVFRKNFLLFGLAFIVFSIITQNMLFNWEGFAYRFEILTGWNGQRSIAYTFNPAGILALFTDCARSIIDSGIGLPLFLLYVTGAVFFIINRHRVRREFFLEAIFIVMSLSVYIFFIQLIRQSSVRFLMPIAISMTVYGAYFLNFLYEKLKGKTRRAVFAALAAVFIYSFYFVLSVDMNFLNDLRYKAEDWMKKNIPADSTLEYYSYLHYLPRFSKDVYAYRVTNDALEIEKRAPDFIVLTSHYYPRFLGSAEETEVIDGRIQSTQKSLQMKKTTDFYRFFNNLFEAKLNYRQAVRFDEGKTWYAKISHAHVSPDHIIIYERIKGEK
ncbi:MAG: glycosyltransferase family 39 protein [Leptospirales bacterium]|nr:glycosyltransferase family 39 protein [Leptospirales bacterium]